jgi:hypothetical protein
MPFPDSVFVVTVGLAEFYDSTTVSLEVSLCSLALHHSTQSIVTAMRISNLSKQNFMFLVRTQTPSQCCPRSVVLRGHSQEHCLSAA